MRASVCDHGSSSNWKLLTRSISWMGSASAAALGGVHRRTSRIHQGSPVRAPALPVEGLVVGVALLVLDPVAAAAGGPAGEAGAAGLGLAPAAVDPRRDRHLHRLAPPARRALALAPRRPRPDQRLRHRRAALAGLHSTFQYQRKELVGWLVGWTVDMNHGARGSKGRNHYWPLVDHPWAGNAARLYLQFNYESDILAWAILESRQGKPLQGIRSSD